MSYVRSRAIPRLDSEVIRSLASLLRLDIPPEDLDSVAESLAAQIESINSLDRVDLTNFLPILKMDPRWHG